jgi:hypothetical protein
MLFSIFSQLIFSEEEKGVACFEQLQEQKSESFVLISIYFALFTRLERRFWFKMYVISTICRE